MISDGDEGGLNDHSDECTNISPRQDESEGSDCMQCDGGEHEDSTNTTTTTNTQQDEIRIHEAPTSTAAAAATTTTNIPEQQPLSGPNVQVTLTATANIQSSRGEQDNSKEQQICSTSSKNDDDDEFDDPFSSGIDFNDDVFAAVDAAIHARSVSQQQQGFQQQGPRQGIGIGDGQPQPQLNQNMVIDLSNEDGGNTSILSRSSTIKTSNTSSTNHVQNSHSHNAL